MPAPNLKWKEPRLRDWNYTETPPGSGIFRALKWKEPRLRDWNSKSLAQPSSPIRLKWKEPRLRDWNASYKFISVGASARNLKWKEPRLRDWNVAMPEISVPFGSILKWKEPRLRDWNENFQSFQGPAGIETWNEKNLDYEIETTWCVRSSIRLFNLKWKEPRLRDWNFRIRGGHEFLIYPAWNEKNLDYEIETGQHYNTRGAINKLEMKRTSITRLKLGSSVGRVGPWLGSLKWKEPRLRDWNELG